jgi:hypothetical protein
VAVNDADARQAGQEGAVEILLQLFVASSTVRPMRLISMRMSSVLALVTVTWTFFCLRAAASGSAFLVRRMLAARRRLGELVALDAHLDGAERDFEEILLDFALHDGDLFMDLMRTWSPAATCLSRCGWALASP